MKKICKNYLIIFCLIQLNYVINEPIFIYEHSRHGERGPSSEYRSLFNNKTFYDEYNIHWEGDGQITLKGKMQHYILGIRNRYKYPNLLNYNEYNPKELLIHVIDSDRVKHSAYNQLLGMYRPRIKIPPNNYSITKMSKSKKFFYPPNYDVWRYKTTSKYKNIINEAELSIRLAEKMNMDNNSNSNSNFFLTQGDFDLNKENVKFNMNVIFTNFSKERIFYKKECLNHGKYINYYHRKNYKKLIKGILDKKYGNGLQKFIGYEKKDWIYGYHRSFSIVDHFIVNYQENRDMSYFLNMTKIDKDDFYKTCKKIYEYWLFHIFCDKKTCVMESSNLMEDLLEYMDNKINNKTNELKMVIDLGHDVTVAPMQLFMYKAFDVDYTACFFGCNLYFELYKTINKAKKENYYVRYYVDDDLRLNIYYEEFKKKVKDYIWSEDDKEEFCYGNIIKVLHPKLFLSFCILLFIAFGLILICVIYKYYGIYYKKERKYSSNLNNENNKNKQGNNNNNNDEKEMELIQ